MEFRLCGTRKDLQEVLCDVESTIPIRYYLEALYETSRIPSLSTLIGPELGSVTDERKNYFVLGKESKIGITYLTAHQKYEIDYGKNMASIQFRPSGVFSEGLMLCGELSEPTRDPESIELFNVFRNAIKKRFSLVNSVYLGKEAEKLFDNGWKVARSARAPSFTHLKRRPLREPYVSALNDNERLGFRESCQLLLSEGEALGNLALFGDWDGKSEIAFPKTTPHPEDEEPVGVRFFHMNFGSVDPDEEEMLLEQLSLPRTFINRCEINGVSFQNTDLSESFICWNDLLNVNLANVDLHNSDMRSNYFRNVTFKESNLTNADLRRATFENCDFANAIMTDCKLDLVYVSFLDLSPEQRKQIDWCSDPGEEPPGG